jgi:hypothetical protein
MCALKYKISEISVLSLYIIFFTTPAIFTYLSDLYLLCTYVNIGSYSKKLFLKRRRSAYFAARIARSSLSRSFLDLETFLRL